MLNEGIGTVHNCLALFTYEAINEVLHSKMIGQPRVEDFLGAVRALSPLDRPLRITRIMGGSDFSFRVFGVVLPEARLDRTRD